MTGTEPLVLAHAGGIPEVLTVAVPMALLAGIIIAGRRRQQQPEDEPPAPGEDDLSS